MNKKNEIVPTMTNYHLLDYTNFNCVQLKQFLKTNKLNVGGSKTELINRLYNYLSKSTKILIIQKYFRRYLVVLYLKYKGPGLFNRSICVNDEDFLTMDNIKSIHVTQFFSFNEDNNVVYGFDILSFDNLIKQSNSQKNQKNQKKNQILNPYNRAIISSSILNKYYNVIRIGEILKLNINTQIEVIKVSNEKIIDLRVLDLFQHINLLGNYSDASWFNNLQRTQLLKIIKELGEIWNFRSQITDETKKAICFPHGNPFIHFSYSQIMNEPNVDHIKQVTLTILENMCTCGIDNDSKTLGSYYVLGALTLVSIPAAIALPWLYQSFIY